MNSANSIVYVVDDDAGVRNAIMRVLQSVGLSTVSFSSAEEFLNGYDPSRPGCLVLDVRMPGMGGMELLDMLPKRGVRIPVIITTGHADVPMAIHAIRSGAFDFLEKPCNGQALLDGIQRAIRLDIETRAREAEKAENVALLAQLTPREKDVLNLILEGKNSKEIAAQLGISRKTLDIHRGRILEKMRSQNAVELARRIELATGSPIARTLSLEKFE